MRFMKRSLVKIAAIGSVSIIGGLAFASPVSANSFGPTDYGTYGKAKVSYDDYNNLLCVGSTNPSGTLFYFGPRDRKPGPSSFRDIKNGETRCFSLAEAEEDTPYHYNVFDVQRMLWGGAIDAHFDS